MGVSPSDEKIEIQEHTRIRLREQFQFRNFVSLLYSSKGGGTSHNIRTIISAGKKKILLFAFILRKRATNGIYIH